MDVNRAFYYDKYFHTDAIKIGPGEFVATNKNIMLVTVLGSCVSVCLRDPVMNIIGMNHFLLPQNITGYSEMTVASYGVNAMELLINDMLQLGAKKRRLQAKVFGGANVLASFQLPNIGRSNSNFVLNYLAQERVEVLAQDLEGVKPRKIYFFPSTGEVKLKRIAQVNNTTIIDRESAYMTELGSYPDDDSITFFGEGTDT